MTVVHDISREETVKKVEDLSNINMGGKGKEEESAKENKRSQMSRWRAEIRCPRSYSMVRVSNKSEWPIMSKLQKIHSETSARSDKVVGDLGRKF